MPMVMAMIALGTVMRIELANPTLTPSQLRPVQALDHASIQGAMVGLAGQANNAPWRISSIGFREVTIIT